MAIIIIIFAILNFILVGTSLEAQWLRLRLPMRGCVGSIPGRGAKIPHASRPKNQNIKKKKRSNIVTDSIKTLKMVHIKKKILKNFILVDQIVKILFFWAIYFDALCPLKMVSDSTHNNKDVFLWLILCP